MSCSDCNHSYEAYCPKCGCSTMGDLEALVRWLGRLYCYNDPETGEPRIDDPKWPEVDEHGTALEANIRLAATWQAVMHPDD